LLLRKAQAKLLATKNGDVDYAAAPNLIPAQQDLVRLRNQVRGENEAPEQPPIQNFIEIPGVRATPLNDLNNRLALISLAMPTLMPHSLGEYTLPRLRAVDWPTWVRHAMLWHDGWFARYPRFPFIAFNTIMRAQVNKKSSWLVNRSGNHNIPFSGNMAGGRIACSVYLCYHLQWAIWVSIDLKKEGSLFQFCGLG
jgi:hypothetical protein